jgi:peptidoglycan/xylan/chitin deacetylase (PgdA/CDA1 family)
LRVPLLLGLPLALSGLIASSGALRARRDTASIAMFHGTPPRIAAELEGQLRYFASQFEIVPLETLVDAVGDAGAGQALRRRLAITFDDGLRDNVTVAYPILRKLGIPATFFVCPGLIDRGAWLWSHEMRLRLRSLGLAPRRALAAGLGAPREVERFIEWMKRLDLAARERVERELRDATRGFVPSQAEREEHELASWSELRALDPAVVTIGSHTLTHPTLNSLGAQAIRIEVAESRRLIEKRLSRPATLFCYPNGDVNPTALECARAHYRGAVTGRGGRVAAGCDPYLLPRAAAPRGVLRLAWNIYP